MRVASNSALIEFAGELSHELANIFTAAAGNLSLLDAECGMGDKDYLQALGDIRHATLRGFDLTAALRAFAGRQTLQAERREINDAVAVILDEARSHLPVNIVPQLLSAPGDLFAAIDAEKLKTAMQALIVNACEAMPKGGRLGIVTSIVPGDDGRDFVRIDVRDNGVGMRPEIAARACDPLVTTKPRLFRHGWGLSIASGFVRQSGGYMELESAPGHGTRVSIFLPSAG